MLEIEFFTMDNQDNLKGFAYIITAIFIWAGWVVVSRYGVRNSFTSYDLTAIRFTTAGLLLLPLAFKKGLRFGKHSIFKSLLMSVLLGAAYTNVATLGMKFTPASHASTIINGSVLVYTTFIGVVFMREAFTRLRFLGVTIIISGILLIIFASTDGNSNVFPDAWAGHLLFILAGIMWGSYIILAKRWRIDAIHATAIVSVMSMLYYMPFYLMFCTSHIFSSPPNAVIMQALYQGVLTAIIAFIFFNKGIMIIGVTTASSIMPLVPVIATLLAVPFLHEVPSFYEWAGVFAVSFGVLLASGVLKRNFLSRFLAIKDKE